MISRLVNKFVPTALLPRRYKTEQLVRRIVAKQAGRSFESFQQLYGLTERELTAFFDVIDEQLGEKINSQDTETMVSALRVAVSEFADFAVRQLEKRSDI
jgi:hypothetical protein